MRSARRFGQGFTFGGRVPVTLGVLIALTVVASIVGVIAERNGFGILSASVLLPGAVWSGQVWRLVTWILFETNPLNLLFAALMLYWFGRDLSMAWGERRFVLTYFAFGAASAAATCLVGRAWPSVLGGVYIGPWPVLDAMIVAWALIFPDRQILIWFALPVSGRALLWVTLGGTVLYAIFGGVAAFVPHLCAEGLMIAFAQGWSVRGVWQRMRIASWERRARRKSKHLRVIERDRDDSRPRWMN